MIARHWTEQNLCGHDRETWARRILSNGTTHVVRACADCGHVLTVAQRFADHPARAAYPELSPHPDPCDCHQSRASTIERLATLQNEGQAGLTWNRAGYDAYLESPEWAERRTYYLARAMHRCQLCKRAGGPGGAGLNVHHADYSRLGAELEIDVIVLCRACHQRHHGHIGRENAA